MYRSSFGFIYLAMPAARKTKWFASNYTADSCPCSLGCQSLWPCTPSRLCWERDPPNAARTTIPDPRTAAATGDATLLLFLAFNSSLVRNVFQAHPERARDREVNRVLWFAQTARSVDTQLPIHVVLAGERDAASESRLLKAGLRLIEGPMVPTPAWASKWHRLSFNKIAALSFTQFSKVRVGLSPQSDPQSSAAPLVRCTSNLASNQRDSLRRSLFWTTMLDCSATSTTLRRRPRPLPSSTPPSVRSLLVQSAR